MEEPEGRGFFDFLRFKKDKDRDNSQKEGFKSPEAQRVSKEFNENFSNKLTTLVNDFIKL